MATRGRIQVIKCGGERGEFIVQAVDPATVQLLMQARGNLDGLKVEAAWVRRPGGREMPELKLVGQLAPAKAARAATKGKT